MNTTAISTSRMSAAVQAESAAAANTAASTVPALMPDPVRQLSASTDIAAQIAAMLIHSLREDRNAARMKSAAEEMTIKQEGERRVASMRDKAGAIRSEGLCSGISQIGGGVMGASGAACGLAGEDKWGALVKESKDVFTGSCTLVAAGPRARQAELDADAEQHKIAADLASKRQQQLDDDARDARELLSKVADFLRECNGARNSARQQAASIRV